MALSLGNRVLIPRLCHSQLLWKYQVEDLESVADVKHGSWSWYHCASNLHSHCFYEIMSQHLLFKYSQIYLIKLMDTVLGYTSLFASELYFMLTLAGICECIWNTFPFVKLMPQRLHIYHTPHHTHTHSSPSWLGLSKTLLLSPTSVLTSKLFVCFPDWKVKKHGVSTTWL